MKIRTLWGFEGNAAKLGTASDQVRAGVTLESVEDEYAHVLIGKGLAVAVNDGAVPKENKQANAAEKKVAAEKAAAEKTEADKAAAEQAAAEKTAADEAEAARLKALKEKP
jgi:topoisomerase IA-like protein